MSENQIANLNHWGNSALLGSGAVGICGSRNADDQALALAERFGRLMAAEGLVVVSGNARGVDDMAQYGALSEGGSVISVLAEGLEGWQPRKRYRDLITSENYLAVSEFPHDARWRVWHAMQRNGTILDLSQALVVVQSGEAGGTWEAGIECLKRRMPLLVVQRQEPPETEGNARLIAKGGLPVATTARLKALLRQLKNDELRGSAQQRPLL
ncbi:MAG: DNA-processing protein DprA [Chloroflexi bacterium]|nr:DNA-processing protein DprA [Chloroflexota bacterium]MDA1240820.1 DNA-processing protein DprA [Chloroflexota bacterium]